MKIIKRLALIFIFIMVILIYVSNIDKDIYYVSMGDSLAIGMDPYGKIGYGYSDYLKDYFKEKGILEMYTKGFSNTDYRTTDLIHDIEDNKEIFLEDKKVTIKNALINADLVTISIGKNDLFYKLGINSFDFNIGSKNELYTYIDNITNDIEKLILLVRKYCKEDIILIGYYNPLANKASLLARELEDIFVYANNNLKRISDENKLYFINVYDIFKANPHYLPNPLDMHPSIEGYEIISKEIIAIVENNIFNKKY